MADTVRRWLQQAPPEKSVQEVVEAMRQYDSPEEAWPEVGKDA